jgi:Tfp pilus assembly protein PilN
MIRVLELDFAATPRRGGWAAYAVLTAVAFATFELLTVHADLLRETETLEYRIAQLERRDSHAPVSARTLDETLLGEIRFANEVIDQLALPWERLFRAVEGASLPRVALLGIAPDAKAGTVAISGEAADSEAMFDYLTRLEQQAQLRDVYLLTHQHDPRNSARPLRFTVTASWNEKQPN